MFRFTSRALMRSARVVAARPATQIFSTPSSSFRSQQVRFCSDEVVKNEIMDEMRTDIKDNQVCLFMKGEPEAPRCGFSSKAAEIMGAYGVPYTSYNVLAHPAVREGVKEISGWPTIPQLFVAGEFIGGCDLMIEMHESGDLAALFKDSGIAYRDPQTGITHVPVQGTDDTDPVEPKK